MYLNQTCHDLMSVFNCIRKHTKHFFHSNYEINVVQRLLCIMLFKSDRSVILEFVSVTIPGVITEPTWQNPCGIVLSVVA